MDQHRIASLDDFEQIASEFLPRRIYSALNSSSHDGITAKENELDFQFIKLKQRGLARVCDFRDLSTSILGHSVSSPIGLGPVPMQESVNFAGEAGTAAAGKRMGQVYAQNLFSTKALKEVCGASAGGLKLFTMPPCLKEELRWELLAKVKEYKDFIGIVIDFDQACQSALDVQISTTQVRMPSRADSAILQEDLGYRFKPVLSGELSQSLHSPSSGCPLAILRQIKEEAGGLPLVVKGVMSAEDALLAAESGADAVWISNSYGTTMDTQPSTIAVLRKIAREVREKFPKVEIYVDSGFKRGTDVLKAIALGANIVFLDKSIYWALAKGGQKGVEEMLQILNQELKTCMILTHCMDISEITEDQVLHKVTGNEEAFKEQTITTSKL